MKTKVAQLLFLIAASVVVSGAHAFNTTRSQGPTVMGGQMVAMYEGTCGMKYPGQPWRVWMDSSGWHVSGPKGSYSTTNSAWQAEAAKVCGEM